MMNKPGGASVGGVGSGAGFGVGNAHAAGPTAAATAAAQQRQRMLLQRADADIGHLLDNFSHLVKAARVNDPVRNVQESFQMEVHASRVVQAADSLLKLVSELKQTAVFSDFTALNEQIEKRSATFVHLNEDTDQLLMSVGEEVAASLQDLESHYYNSPYRTVTVEKSDDHKSNGPSVYDGQKYFGRGPLQIRGNNNYGLARDVGGARANILKNPDLVAQDPVIAFRTAFYLWTRKDEFHNIPSVHDVMVRKWRPTKADTKAGRKAGFRMTINILNGGAECGKYTMMGSSRINLYKDFCQTVEVDPGINLDCMSMQPYKPAKNSL